MDRVMDPKRQQTTNNTVDIPIPSEEYLFLFGIVNARL
jgi:hypothetical protein